MRPQKVLPKTQRHERTSRIVGKADEYLDTIRDTFTHFLKQKNIDKLRKRDKAEIGDLLRFVHFFSEMFVLNLAMKGETGDSWKDDGLDVRSSFAELNTRFRTLKTKIWDDFDNFSAEEAYKLFVEIAVSSMRAARRLEIEHDVDPEVVGNLIVGDARASDEEDAEEDEEMDIDIEPGEEEETEE